jgi:hypothetical protein
MIAMIKYIPAVLLAMVTLIVTTTHWDVAWYWVVILTPLVTVVTYGLTLGLAFWIAIGAVILQGVGESTKGG